MARIFSKPNLVKLPKSRTEEQEFGKAKKGLRVCRTCGAFYFQKSWHHNADAFISRREGKDISMVFVLCPACDMAKKGLYEGRVIIEHVPAQFMRDLPNFITAYCRRAFLRDSQHRLIAIEKSKSEIVITLTENQLAVKLAKKIKDTCNTPHLKIMHNKEPSDVSLVRVIFP